SRGAALSPGDCDRGDTAGNSRSLARSPGRIADGYGHLLGAQSFDLGDVTDTPLHAAHHSIHRHEWRVRLVANVHFPLASIRPLQDEPVPGRVDHMPHDWRLRP